jgi:hypothetical protein
MDQEQFEPLPREVIRRVLDAGLKLDLVPIDGSRGGSWSWSPGGPAVSPAWVARVRYLTGPLSDRRAAGHGKEPMDALYRGLEELAERFSMDGRDAAADAARARLADRKAAAAQRAGSLRAAAEVLISLRGSISAGRVPNEIAESGGIAEETSGR